MISSPSFLSLLGTYNAAGIAASLLLFSCLGCTTMPPGFTKGDTEIHPRFGYQVTNETAESFDLEVNVIWFAFACTNGGRQLDDSKAAFVKFAQSHAASKGKTLAEIPLVELAPTHVRNPNDGGCSVRVAKRLRWQ